MIKNYQQIIGKEVINMDRINAIRNSGMKEVRTLTISNAEARRLLKQLQSSNAAFITMPAKGRRPLAN